MFYVLLGKKEEMGQFRLSRVWRVRPGFIEIKHLWNYGSCQWEDVFRFEKKSRKELLRTVSVGKSKVGGCLSGKDKQWKWQGRPGTGWEADGLGLDPDAVFSWQAQHWAHEFMSVIVLSRGLNERRRIKKRLRRGGDVMSPFVGSVSGY